jgi:hypothetical protein
MADANTKLSRYKNTATASQGLHPLIHTYFDGTGGGLEADVQARFRECTLNLKDVMSSAGRNLDEDGSPAEADQCSTHLHCARPTAPSTATHHMCDVMGVVGWVCVHGIPLNGMFCNMPSFEQFSYYLLALARLAGQHSVLDIYIDFGCRFKVTWQRYAQALEASGQLEAQQLDLRIMVNWMHGSSHELSCQLQHCGRYIEGAGAADGEGCERLWSNVKVG